MIGIFWKPQQVFLPGFQKCKLNLLAGVQPFGISGPHWKKMICLGPHIKYIVTRYHKTSHNVLSKFMTLCWATFTGSLGCVWPASHKLNTPATVWARNNWRGKNGHFQTHKWLKLLTPHTCSFSSLDSLKLSRRHNEKSCVYSTVINDLFMLWCLWDPCLYMYRMMNSASRWYSF